MNTEKHKNLFLYLITILSFGIFYYFLPFAGDDWAWGSDLGLQRLQNGFDGYNGRYIGNLLIILLTRSVIAKIIICTAIMFLLIFILSKIFDNLSNVKNSSKNYIIAFSSVLVLILPNQIAFGELQPFQIFGSTIGWLSGFTNYVVPSVLILIYYYFVTNKNINNNAVNILLFFDAIIACLCVEHYTLFSVLFSFSVIAYRFYYDRKICKKSLSFFIGSVIGAMIMFLNSSYISMQKGDASSKQRAVGFLGSFKQYANFIFPKGTNQIIIIAFEVALIAGILAFFIFFFKKCYKAFKNRNIANLLPMICVVIMTLPLLFTNSGKEIYIVAPRCYFLQYFMIVIYLYNKYAKKDREKHFSNTKKFKTALNICFALLFVITTALYCQLGYMGIVRDDKVNEALVNDSSTVEIVKYPKNIEHIQWASNSLKDETYSKRYKAIKSIPNDKKVKLVKYEQ